MNKTERMTETELVDAFGSIGSESNAWRGLMDVLEEAKENEVRACATPGLTSEARHENSGRLAAVMDVKGALEAIMRTAEGNVEKGEEGVEREG